MVTRTEQRLAGVAALLTAAALATGLVLFDGGPSTTHGGAVRLWFDTHVLSARLAALAWLGAAIALVAFAVAVREAVWATVLDRHWATVLFVQGAVGFAAVTVVASAILWAVAEQSAAGAITADGAGTLWAVGRTLWRFATWGLTVPLVVVGLVLHRYSTLGRLAGVVGVVVACGLLVPATWSLSLYGVVAWLVLAGLTFLAPHVRRSASLPAAVRRTRTR